MLDALLANLLERILALVQAWPCFIPQGEGFVGVVQALVCD
jgi:hypothetical protein